MAWVFIRDAEIISLPFVSRNVITSWFGLPTSLIISLNWMYSRAALN